MNSTFSDAIENFAEEYKRFCEAMEKIEDRKNQLINDPVNHPNHYTASKYECIDVIFDVLSFHTDSVSGWLTGQIIKYIWRWPLKNGVEDLKKIRFYLNRLIEYEENKNQNGSDNICK